MGRTNYREAGKELGIKLEEFPTLALNPEPSARIAGYFWQSRGLNELADKSDFEEITHRINGGLIKYKEKCMELKRIKNIFLG
jgi:putative chitinase